MIALIGEAWGLEEFHAGRPFVGPSGKLLRSMLADVGIDQNSCFFSNVVNAKPVNNDFSKFCCSRDEARAIDPTYGLKMISSGKYLHPKYVPHLRRLYDDLLRLQPSVIVALGKTALWALTGHQKITTMRGYVFRGQAPLEDFTVLPTYHPAAVLRQYSLKVITTIDLSKARALSKAPYKKPRNKIHIEPTLQDLTDYVVETLTNTSIQHMAFDIETANDQITCIGFATRPDNTFVVPFVDKSKHDKSYWQTKEEEIQAWKLVQALLESPIAKITQNGLYDIQWLWKKVGIRPRNCRFDTMLMHHALWPEMPKSLGFMGSYLTNEPLWKDLRTRDVRTNKDED